MRWQAAGPLFLLVEARLLWFEYRTTMKFIGNLHKANVYILYKMRIDRDSKKYYIEHRSYTVKYTIEMGGETQYKLAT